MFLISPRNNFRQCEIVATDKIMLGQISKFSWIISIVDFNSKGLHSFEVVIDIDSLYPLWVQRIRQYLSLTKFDLFPIYNLIKNTECISFR